MFVDPTARVAVTLGENTIYIRAKMDAKTRALIQDELRASRGRSEDGDEDGSEMRGLGSYQLLLRVHNILDWEGPDFVDERGKKIPCTRADIGRMDPTDPLYDLVGERIGELNAEPEKPEDSDPN